MKALSAALDAEYAGIVTAGIIARLEPVLYWLVNIYLLLVMLELTHNTMLAFDFLWSKNGRKACTIATKLEKLTFISEMNFERSTFSGWEKSKRL